MRYSVLVHLTKMVRTLQEAAAYVDTAPDGDPQCAALLSDGAEMLAQLRAVLEQHREDLRTEAPLTHLSAAEALWDEGGDILQGALEAFAQSLPEDVRYQVRAVFFTGLGSTWDAMESVYAFMREDPRFDPVVVLIPIFRQAQRGGEIKQEVMYNDYLTPLGIPFYEYTQYHIENDLPDLAFINQPYESVVLQDYWPETIAKYTRLVYLPYFPPFSIFTEIQDMLCSLPVYRHAWKVVGSSERHYQYYRRYAANGGSNMLVTGVPKWDPTVRLRTHPAAPPKAWQAYIQGKKVFLWNTFYDYSGSSIPYFETIYQWFQAHQDCALIWRTHPMTDTVTKLHYPATYYERLQKYIALTDAAPNMIFDREASYDAAFCCSIAQISDLSSMMFQYLLLDKPVLYIRTSGRGKVEQEFIIDSCWMDQAGNTDEIIKFLEEICAGTDRNAALRELVRQRDIPLADGQCGVRLGNRLWTLMHQEDQILCGPEENA